MMIGVYDVKDVKNHIDMLESKIQAKLIKKLEAERAQAEKERREQNATLTKLEAEIAAAR